MSEEWSPAPPEGRIELVPGEVHLWAATLPLPPVELAECERLLAGDERERAASPLPEARERYVAVRGLLRRLLGLYLGRPAEALCFAYGAHGKPSLAGEGPGGVRFNVSHAGEVALLAFAAGREVGVDVERVRDVPRAERIATRILEPAAAEAWRALPPAERREAFLREWTRVEAMSKLTGRGVWRTLVHGESRGPSCSFEVRPAPGYVGTLVVEGDGARLRPWRYQVGLLSSSASSSSGGSGGEK